RGVGTGDGGSTCRNTRTGYFVGRNPLGKQSNAYASFDPSVGRRGNESQVCGSADVRRNTAPRRWASFGTYRGRKWRRQMDQSSSIKRHRKSSTRISGDV